MKRKETVLTASTCFTDAIQIKQVKARELQLS